MSPLLIAIIAGLAAGLVASAIMEVYQGLAAPLFDQHAKEDPATVKAADSAKEAVGAKPVTQKHRSLAGRGVHYATGLALGLLYGVVALYLPPVTLGFGIAFGIVVALILDDIVVPALGWGPPAWKTPLNTHLYGLSAHVVFGAVLEGVRRVVVGLF